MNLWLLIFQAGPVAKLTLLFLIFISIGTWAVIFLKWREFQKIEKELTGLSREIERSEGCVALAARLRRYRQTAGWRVVRALLTEFAKWRAEGDGNLSAMWFESFFRRLSRQMVVAKERELLNLRRYLPFLAVAGNSSPFIGLFGTVWGIMSAFHDIGLKGSASLATVAPGIAEALVATALGLFAAIPAAVAYNFFTAHLERLETRLNELGELVLLLVEKDLWREGAFQIPNFDSRQGSKPVRE